MLTQQTGSNHHCLHFLLCHLSSAVCHLACSRKSWMCVMTTLCWWTIKAPSERNCAKSYWLWTWKVSDLHHFASLISQVRYQKLSYSSFFQGLVQPCNYCKHGSTFRLLTKSSLHPALTVLSPCYSVLESPSRSSDYICYSLTANSKTLLSKKRLTQHVLSKICANTLIYGEAHRFCQPKLQIMFACFPSA